MRRVGALARALGKVTVEARVMVDGKWDGDVCQGCILRTFAEGKSVVASDEVTGPEQVLYFNFLVHKPHGEEDEAASGEGTSPEEALLKACYALRVRYLGYEEKSQSGYFIPQRVESLPTAYAGRGGYRVHGVVKEGGAEYPHAVVARERGKES